MPQQSLIPRNNDGSPLDRMTVYEATPSRPNAASTAPVTAYLDDIGSLFPRLRKAMLGGVDFRP